MSTKDHIREKSLINADYRGCDYRAKQVGNLIKHKRNHTREKP